MALARLPAAAYRTAEDFISAPDIGTRCPQCGRNSLFPSDIAICQPCRLIATEQLLKEGSRQDRLVELARARDSEFISHKMIGTKTYAAVIRIMFGARLIVGQCDDVHGYELGWDFASAAEAIVALAAWNGRGEPFGYTRSLQALRGQSTNPVYGGEKP